MEVVEQVLDLEAGGVAVGERVVRVMVRLAVTGGVQDVQDDL